MQFKAVYRVPVLHDASKVYCLLTELSSFVPDFSEQTSIWSLFLNDPSSYSLVAIHDSHLIAFGYFYCIATPRGGYYATIQEVVVSKKYRRKSVGLNLINYLIQAAFQEKSCFKVELACNISNQNFYQKCGFTQDGVNMVLRNTQTS